MTRRSNALPVILLTAAAALVVLIGLALACGPAAPSAQSNTPASPSMPAPASTIALSNSDTDTDGDGYLNYEAINVDTGKILRAELSPTALTLNGAYPEGDYRVYLHRYFRNDPMVRIKSTGQRFIRVTDDMGSACEVTEAKVLATFNGAATKLDWYQEDTILVRSRLFTTRDPEAGQDRMLWGYTYGLDQGLGIENNKEYLLFITPESERAGRSVSDPYCPFWGDETYYHSGLGASFQLWEIAGARLKETQHYGKPYDLSATERELFANAGGVTGAGGKEGSHTDETLLLSLPEVLKLASPDPTPTQ